MLATAIEIALEAGRFALEARGTATHTDKRDGSWVTQADRATEELIRRRLAQAFPGHGVHGEEFGAEAADGCQECWLVDPIDGTVNYVMGLPIWGVALGLMRDGVPELGVFVMPVTGDVFSAERGGGAHLNGEPIRSDRRGVMDRNSLVALNSDALQAYELHSPALVRNLGSAAAHGCYVASGSMAAALFLNCHAWDLAAALCIAMEAGAQARWLDGTPVTRLSEGGADSADRPLLIGPDFALDALLPAIHPRPEACSEACPGAGSGAWVG